MFAGHSHGAPGIRLAPGGGRRHRDFFPVSGHALAFDLPGAADAALRIYDVSGRLVRELARERLPAGRHEFRWDGRDGEGRRVARGTYLARLEADQVVRTRKVSVAR